MHFSGYFPPLSSSLPQGEREWFRAIVLLLSPRGRDDIGTSLFSLSHLGERVAKGRERGYL